MVSPKEKKLVPLSLFSARTTSILGLHHQPPLHSLTVAPVQGRKGCTLRKGCREDFCPCFGFQKQLAVPGQGMLAACSPTLPQQESRPAENKASHLTCCHQLHKTRPGTGSGAGRSPH